ncbi:MAG: ATP-binding protein, partial [Proteobacteria bacterium]|nr:ATP-binding protein [Pseudomonadota bacterium]
AITIGLLPDFPDCDYSQIGNAAGSGARQMLLSVKQREEAERIAGDMDFLELSNHKDFPPTFARHMSLSQ